MSTIALPQRAPLRTSAPQPNPDALSYGRHRGTRRITLTADSLVGAARLYQTLVWSAVIGIALTSRG